MEFKIKNPGPIIFNRDKIGIKGDDDTRLPDDEPLGNDLIQDNVDDLLAHIRKNEETLILKDEKVKQIREKNCRLQDKIDRLQEEIEMQHPTQQAMFQSLNDEITGLKEIIKNQEKAMALTVQTLPMSLCRFERSLLLAARPS